MPETIGKYQLLERIGRGGMGMIFKAHDPILDRPVALKVISTEIEVTDELRTRFFREAQACARLSHPNIVTIYDMGEDAGRLFIVMELLEGDELRRLIAQRTELALEDKLAIMGQVCKGLHYAHQRGIVHRDIKPGNILVQRNGQVKILDFGIAQIATTDGGLTRTGLIMGTLRYISPEQVRGRADARSDMFSVGAVLYELLSLRPPFSGENPLHLLEQLRTEEPPRLSEVDRTIPVDVAAIVERAIRKEPEERFADLEEMRARIEQVQRGLAEEAQQARARVRAQRDHLLQLEAALAERVGPPRDKQEVAAIDERGRLATAQAMARDFADRIEMLRVQLARADRLTGAVERGIESLEEGQFADAVMELEAAVAEMPEHGRAVEALGRARAGAAEERGRQLAAKLVQEARAALDEGGGALGLELLRQAAEIHPSAEATLEIAGLRERAEAAQAMQEAARRARQQEGPRHALTGDAKVIGTAGSDTPVATGYDDATRFSSPVPGIGDTESVRPWRRVSDVSGDNTGWPWGRWARGIAIAVGGLAAIGAGIYWLPRAPLPEVRPSPQVTQAPTARSPESPVVREAAKELRKGAMAAREEATSANAERLAKAEANRPVLPSRKEPDARAGQSRAVDEAAGARMAAARSRQDAEQARARMASARRAAEQAAAGFHAPRLFASAQARERDGIATLGQSDYSSALRLFGEAQSDYQAAAQEARQEADAERQLAPLQASVEQSRARAAVGRGQALSADAERLAKDLFDAAQAKHVEADSLVAQQNLAAAARAYHDAADRYVAAAQRAQAARGAR